MVMLPQLIRSYISQVGNVGLRSTFQLQSMLSTSFRDKVGGKQTQRDKKLRPPKRPPTPFLLFYREQFSKLWDSSATTDRKVPIVAKKLSEIWNSKPDYEKKLFQDRCDQLWEYYNERLSVYEEQATDEDKSIVREEKAMRKKRKLQILLVKDRKENVPPRPSPFALFIHEKSRLGPKSHGGPQFFREAAEDWRKMSEDRKKVYREKSSAKMQTYNQRLQSWREKQAGKLL